MRVLSIDAWADADDGWTWNDWHEIGQTTLPKNESDADLISRLEREGYLAGDLSLAEVYDDGYNVTIIDKRDQRPVIAVEYGAEA